MKPVRTPERLLQRAIEEDIGSGDITTELTVPEGKKATAWILSKGEGVLAGVGAAAQVFALVGPQLQVFCLLQDGAPVREGEKVMTIKGSARAILTAERVALNFLQHLSGIATLTSQFVQAASPTIILDTRKTTPGLRQLEKAAVVAGGGQNHRQGLYDRLLIKDNHIKVAGSITRAVGTAKKSKRPIEVEVSTLDEVAEALAAKADTILLDNMSDEELKAAVQLVKGQAKLEASGNMTLNRVKKIGHLGLDFISVGALTHSAPALDLSLEVDYED